MIEKLVNLFKRKSSAAAPLIFGAQEGRVAFPPRDMETLIKEGYEQNPVVYKVVDDIARNTGSIQILVYSGDKEVENHPFTSLISRSNPTQSLGALLRDIVTAYLVTGNAYIEAVPVGSRLVELWPKQSQRMRIKPGSSMVASYEYHSGAGVVSWPVDQVSGASHILHLRTPSMSSDFYGTSPLEAAASNVDQLNEIDVWNYSTLRRGPMYRGIFTTDGTQISDEELSELRAQLDGNKFSGSRSGGRPPILPPGITWQNTSVDPRAMAITESKDLTARFICMTFGYPPLLLGMAGGSTFANVSEAREYLWDNTIIPLADYIMSEMSNWLQQWYPGISLRLDLDQISALESRRERAWMRLQQADFLTINEKREALGYNRIDGGDSVLVGSGMLPIGEPVEMKKWDDEHMSKIRLAYRRND